jgi:integrase
MPETAKLTKRIVEAIPIPPKGKQAEVWDSDLAGLHVRVQASGRRTYRFKYRSAGRQVIVTLGQHGPVTAEQARERALTLAAAVADGRDPAQEKQAAKHAAEEERRRAITLAELSERWFSEGPDANPDKRASSWASDRIAFKRHINPLIGKVLVRDLKRDDVERMQRSIAAGATAMDERTGPRGRAIVRGGRAAAARAVGVLSSCLSWAQDRGIVSANPCQRVKKLRVEARERFLSEAEVGRLLDVVAAMEAEAALLPVFADAIRLLLLTGARRSEVLNLRWEEVDLERGLIVLGGVRHKSGNTQGKKAIPVSAPVAALIAQRPRLGPYVFASPRNALKPAVGLPKAWRAVRARAGLLGVRPHDLRHSFASFGAAGGASLLLIGKALGHSQAATTARYAHLGNDPVRDLAEKVGATIMGAQGTRRTADNGATNGDNITPLRLRPRKDG